jgi:hypothetical protein
MRRRLLWLLALAGLVWLYLRRGPGRPAPDVHVPPAADPAEELRRRLEATKGRERDVSEKEAAEQPAPAPDEIEARRRAERERARSAAEEMRRSGSD